MRGSALGFIPTDWYPSALAVHGDDLLIATAKGEGTRPNPGPGKTAWEVRHHEHPYIPTLLRGSIARLEYSFYSSQARRTYACRGTRQSSAQRPRKDSIRSGKNPIKHVIYVIKENRTYDQILGDLKVGDGDPSLTMYGADITPNEHKLALQFGVLDNFYDSGEVSGDGHLWSTAAITSDYNEKTWQIAYRGKERTYDFQGTVADEYPLDHKQPDIDDPSTGYLWDNVARNNLSYRDYGEYVNAQWCNKVRKAASPKQGTPSAQESPCPQTELHQGDSLPPNVGDPHGAPSPYPWTVPLFKGVKPTKAVLRDHFDALYPDFNTDYPDQLRADEFLNEFAAYTHAREANETQDFQLPAFVLLYLPDDHTGGTRPERPRPAASVADNDLALGRVVDAVSHSPYWDDTAIFILEDDAQDGGDHVDAHRSIAFVVSKYSPGKASEPYVDHRFYTTVNVIHTMEMLLGLPPMNQNDAYAPAMGPMFSGAGDQPAFKADYRNLKNGLIYETNRRDAKGANESAKMDFSRPDAAGAARLNEVLWRDQKGDTPVPEPKQRCFRREAIRQRRNASHAFPERESHFHRYQPGILPFSELILFTADRSRMSTAVRELRSVVMILVEASWEDESGALQKIPARMEDRSAGGACIRMKRPVAVGAKLTIQWRFDRFCGITKYCRSDGREFLVGIQRDKSAVSQRAAWSGSGTAGEH